MPTREIAYTKPFGVLRDRLQPCIGTRRRSQKNRRKVHAAHLAQILARLFDNHVGGQHAIHAGRRGIVGKLAQAIAQNRIQIAEDHQSRIRSRSANLARKPKNILQSRAARQCPFTCPLDDRAHRASGSLKGTPSSITSAPASIAASRNFACCVEAGIAGRQINNQARLVIETDRHINCARTSPKYLSLISPHDLGRSDEPKALLLCVRARLQSCR